MNVTGLNLIDVGPFAKWSAELDGRMVGVTGSNGAGKSTVLRAIAFAVTGNTNVGQKDAVRIGRVGDEQPTVVMRFTTYAGLAGAVCRWLPVDKKAGRHAMTIGEESYATADAIARVFESDVGVSLQALREVVFVEQGHLTDVVAAPAAKRAEAFQKVFGLEAANRTRAAAIDELADVPAPVDAAELNEAFARLADLRLQMDRCTSDLLESAVPNAAEVDWARNVISSANRRSSLIGVRDRLGLAIRDLVATIAIPVRYGDRDLEGEERALRARLIAAQNSERIADAEEDVRRAEAEIPDDPGPPPVEPARLVALRDRRYVIDFIAGLTGSDSCACPVCSGPWAPTDEAKARAISDRVELSQLEKAYETVRSTHAKMTTLRADGIRRATNLAKEYDRVRRSLGGVAEHTPSEQLTLELDTIVRMRREKISDESDKARARVDEAARRKDLADVETEINALATDENIESARAFLTGAEAQMDRRRSLDARAEVLRTAVESADREYARRKNAADRADTMRRHRTVVSEVVSVLHRDAAPAVAAARALSSLTDAVNLRLEQVSADYRVAVSADGEIICSFGDGSPNRRAGLLSPGQQMALALAWRVALVDRYCPRAGLLCLDEPTTGLDEIRIRALRLAFDAWRSADSGPQFLVVTHDHRLCGAFDRVIDL